MRFNPSGDNHPDRVMVSPVHPRQLELTFPLEYTMSNSILRINTRELATILNALRNFQIQENAVIDEYFEDVDGGPLSHEEINGLCERINGSETLDVVVVYEDGVITNAVVDSAKSNVRLFVMDNYTEETPEEFLASLNNPITGTALAGMTLYEVAALDNPQFMDKYRSEFNRIEGAATVALAEIAALKNLK